MNETHIDWDDLRLFLAVARHGGLAAAAASTGKSAPTLGRRMLSLERRLGNELFVRLPRGYALTAQGEGLLAQVGMIEGQIDPLTRQALGRGRPVVKLSAGIWVTHVLCSRISEIIGPDRVRVRMVAADEVLDINRREAVIGIRNRRPEGPGLAGRKITRVHFAVYATSPAVRDWARVLAATPSARWAQASLDPGGAIEITSPRSALDMALAGGARVVLPTFVGRRYAALVPVTPRIAALEHD